MCDVAAWLSEEDNHKQAYYVEGGQERCEQRHSENRCVAFVGERENCILTEKSTERWAADQREGAHNKTGKCDRKFPVKPSHFPDVLFVVKHHNDGTRGEEKKRFKKRMSKQVEHRCIIRRKTHRHNHVTQL